MVLVIDSMSYTGPLKEFILNFFIITASIGCCSSGKYSHLSHCSCLISLVAPSMPPPTSDISSTACLEFFSGSNCSWCSSLRKALSIMRVDTKTVACGKTVRTLSEMTITCPNHVRWIKQIMCVAKNFLDAMVFQLAGASDYVMEYSDFRAAWKHHVSESASSDTIEIPVAHEKIAFDFYEKKNRQLMMR